MSHLDYSETQQTELEKTVSQESLNQLQIDTFVEPDAIILTDSQKTIRVSKAKNKSYAFIEFNGKTGTIVTNKNTRYDSVKKALAKIAQKHTIEQNTDLHQTVELLLK